MGEDRRKAGRRWAWRLSGIALLAASLLAGCSTTLSNAGAGDARRMSHEEQVALDVRAIEAGMDQARR